MSVAALAEASRPVNRHVTVFLTPFAPRCADRSVNDRRRWKTYWNIDTVEVIRQLLDRLSLPPGKVAAELQGNGDIAILGPAAPETLIEGDPVAADRPPLALIFDDVDLAAVQGALDALRRRGWTPSIFGEVH